MADAIERSLYTCPPFDPYFPDTCMAPGWAHFGILVGCWVLATYLVTRRETIGWFACLFIGLMLWFGLAAGFYISYRVNDTRLFEGTGFSDVLLGVLVGMFFAMLVIGSSTFALGSFIQAWRERGAMHDRRMTVHSNVQPAHRVYSTDEGGRFIWSCEDCDFRSNDQGAGLAHRFQSADAGV